MNRASLHAPLRLVTPLKLYPGYIYGMHQPSVVCAVQVQELPTQVWTVQIENLCARLGISPKPLVSPHSNAQVAQWLVAITGEMVGALQRGCRIPVSQRLHVGHGLPAPSGGGSIYQLVLPCVRPDAVRLSLEWVFQTVNSVLNTAETNELETWLEDIQRQLKPFGELGANRYSIVLSADQLGIPVLPLTRGILVLGQGHRARWLESTITDQTPAISIALARDKSSTATVLRQAGLPGAVHQLATSEAQALEIASRLGYPVVVKPVDQEQGRGVAADLRNAQQVSESFRVAQSFSKQILVEKWQAGHTHRLTVFQGHVFRVTQRVAGGVTGDGVHTIAELVAIKQAKGVAQRQANKRLLSLDAEALGLLEQYQLNPDDVPAVGAYVRLRRRDNINAGGENIKLTLEQVHPDNLRLAQDAALLLRLDIAGIDFITTDITRSWHEVGGVICEVNAQPQLGATSHADAYPVMLRALLPECGYIPVRLVLCPDDVVVHQKLLQQVQANFGVNGVASRYGVWVDGVLRTAALPDGLAAARALFQRQDVKAAACLMTVSDVLAYGAPSNHIDEVITVGTASWPASERNKLQLLNAVIGPYLSSSASKTRAVSST